MNGRNEERVKMSKVGATDRVLPAAGRVQNVQSWQVSQVGLGGP